MTSNTHDRDRIPPEDKTILAGNNADSVPPVPAIMSLPVTPGEATIIAGGPEPAPQSDSSGNTHPTVPSREVTEFGDYLLYEELGRGPHGVVYRAKQLSLDRVVAVKILFPARLPDATTVGRFRAAMERTARLDHPGIVRVFEVGTHDGFHYVATALCEGRSLESLLANDMLPVRESVRLLREMAEILHTAHSQDVLHLGLKPSQVFVGRDGSLKVTDFGLARSLGREADPAHWTWLAPEQIREPAVSSKGPGIRSDLYAAGELLYALLTGRPPFGEAATVDDAVKERRDPPLPASRLNSEANADLDAICYRCLDSAAWRRYASAVEFMGDLLRWLHHRPLKRVETSYARQGILWARRNRASLAPLLVLGLVLGLIPEMGSRAWQRTRRSRAFARLVSKQQPVERYEQIRRQFQRAHAQSPKDTEARLGLGVALFRLGRIDDAAGPLLADPKALSREFLTELHFRKGDLAEAAAAWSQPANLSNPNAFRVPDAEIDAMFHDIPGLISALRRGATAKSGIAATNQTIRTFCQQFLDRTDASDWRGEAASQSVGLWTDLLSDRHADLTGIAAQALGRIGPPAHRAIPRLVELVTIERGPETSPKALAAIQQIDSDWMSSSDAQVALEKLQIPLSNTDHHTTLRLIAEFGTAAQPWLDNLIKFLAYWNDDMSRDANVATLDRIDSDWRNSSAARIALDNWKDVLRGDSIWQKSNYAHAIGRLGPAGRAALTELVVYAAQSEAEEQVAQYVLRQLDEKWEETTEARAAISTIVAKSGATYDHSHRERTLTFLDRHIPDWRNTHEAAEGVRKVVERLSQWESYRQVLRINFVSQCGKAAGAAVPVLAEALADRSTKVRETASSVLEQIDPDWQHSDKARAAIVPLVLRLTSDDEDVRNAARQVLLQIDSSWATSDADRFLPPLISQLKSRDLETRTMTVLDEIAPGWPKLPAVHALVPSLVVSSISEDSPGGLKVLERMDPVWFELPQAEEAVPGLILRLIAGGGPKAEGLVLERLARIGPKAKQAADSVAAYLPGGRQRAKAVLALAAIAPERLKSVVQVPRPAETHAFEANWPQGTPDEPAWRRLSFVFKAETELTRIEFLSLDDRDPSAGPRLDQVRVTLAGDPENAPSLLSNGSFEKGASLPASQSFEVSSRSEPRRLEHWSVIGSSVTVIGSLTGADEGERSLVLSGTQGWGGIAQSLATEPGQSYRVSFALAAHQEVPLRETLVAARALGITPMAADKNGRRPKSPEELFLELEIAFLTRLDMESLEALRCVDPDWSRSALGRATIPRVIRRRLKGETQAAADATLAALNARWAQSDEAIRTISELVETLQDPARSDRTLETLELIDRDWQSRPGCREGMKSLLSDLASLPAGATAQRIRILEVLAQIGPVAADAVPVLIRFVPHDDLTLAQAAEEALDAIDAKWPKRSEAREILFDLVIRVFRDGGKRGQFAKRILDRMLE